MTATTRDKGKRYDRERLAKVRERAIELRRWENNWERGRLMREAGVGLDVFYGLEDRPKYKPVPWILEALGDAMGIPPTA